MPVPQNKQLFIVRFLIFRLKIFSQSFVIAGILILLFVYKYNDPKHSYFITGGVQSKIN